MIRRSIPSAAVLCALAASSFAQPRTRVTINEATVFLRGAQLGSTASINLPAGESEYLFTNIAGNINQQSINVGTSAEVAVQSVIFKNDYLGDSSVSPAVRQLNDSISWLSMRRGPIQDEKQVISSQLETLRQNQELATGKNGVTVEELRKLLDLIAQRTDALLRRNRSLDSLDGVLESRINKLQSQVSEEQRRGFQPGGAVLVRFYSPRAVATRVNLSYVTPNAGWAPAYDLRVEKINAPVKLFYKAHVYQNSGVKWDNVRLTLSTGNPTEGAEAPAFSAQVVGQSGSDVVVRAAKRYAAPLIDPAGPGGRSTNAGQLEAAATRNSMDIASLSMRPFRAENGGGLTIGGSRSSGTMVIVDGIRQDPNTSLNTYTFANGDGINTTFDIELPYTIPADGQQHTVAVKTYELPASYRYYTAPRQDKDVFLQAQVTNWEDLNLIPAPTSVFFEGYYVGQGQINMNNVKDTLNLSLGRDKKIIVSRERDRNFRSQKIVGPNARQEYAWTISVRNTRSETVNLVVVDQVPVSERSDISIEDINTPDASLDAGSGRVEWKFGLKPSETQKLQMRFTVRYPKHISIAGL